MGSLPSHARAYQRAPPGEAVLLVSLTVSMLFSTARSLPYHAVVSGWSDFWLSGMT
jgi:hypothetical protein